jgi:hypothetical protein
MLSREATNTNFIVFGLIRSGLEPTIYCTQGKHANHYTTDAVGNWFVLKKKKKRKKELLVTSMACSKMAI